MPPSLLSRNESDSIRNRRSSSRSSRSSCSSIPDLKRCSIASVQSTSNTVSDTGETESPGKAPRTSAHAGLGQNPSTNGGLIFFLRNLFVFDSLHPTSTKHRNQRMLSALSQTNGHDGAHDSHPPIYSYVPHFGMDVCFVPHRFHYTESELEPYRKIGDPEMNDLLEYLATRNGANGAGCGAFDDVVSFSKQAYEKEIESSPNNTAEPTTSNDLTPLAKFYEHYYSHLPDWVDFDQIQRGVNVFVTYLPAAVSALFYRSLVGGFSIPKIVEVLISTRYLVPSSLVSCGDKPDPSAKHRDDKRTFERLLDTGGFLACCFAPSDNKNKRSHDELPAEQLRPGGKGWEAALRVRVLHAKVRRNLLSSTTRARAARWDVETNGIPINQEDMAATLLAFSVNVLWGIELVAGKPLPDSDQRDYLALWRYLGWLLGVDTFENIDDAIYHTSNPTVGAQSGLGSNALLRNKTNNLTPIDPCGPSRQCLSGHRNSKEVHCRVICNELEWIESDPDTDSLIHAYASLESIILHLLHPEQKSRVLVSHLLNLRASKPEPNDAQDHHHKHATKHNSKLFLFRSEICRKFLGDPLSDALEIPSLSWHSGSYKDFISSLFLKFFVYAYLVTLRCYANLSMGSPLFRGYTARWHSSLFKKVLYKWEKGHARRVSDAYNNRQGNHTGTPVKQNISCPFSMMMPPKLD